MNRSAPFLLIDIRQIEPNGKAKNFSYSFFRGKGCSPPLWGKTVFYLHDKEEQTG